MWGTTSSGQVVKTSALQSRSLGFESRPSSLSFFTGVGQKHWALGAYYIEIGQTQIEWHSYNNELLQSARWLQVDLQYGSFHKVGTRFVTASPLHLWTCSIHYPLLDGAHSLLFKWEWNQCVPWTGRYSLANSKVTVKDNRWCQFTDVTGTPSQIVS